MEIQFDFFDESLLLNVFISRLQKKVMKEMPRLEHEPLIEYNEHIREEVEYRAVELVKTACKNEIGERNEKWKDC